MKHLLHPLLLLVLSLNLVSCHSAEEPAADTDALQQLDAPATSDAPAPTEAPQPQGRKLIQRAHLSFQVEHLEQSTARVDALLHRHNAFLAGTRSFTSEGRAETAHTIKVEPAHLYALVRALEQESVALEKKEVETDDVTLQYVDLEARLKAQRALEARYLELLKKAEKIPDVLSIEQELKKVQSDLEAMQARLLAMQSQTSYSTINLSMYQLVPVVPTYSEPTFVTRAVEAVTSGWQLLLSLLIGLLYLWPLLVAIPAGVWLYHKWKMLQKV